MARVEDKEKYEPLVKVFRQGLRLYRMGNFTEALEAFEDILSAYPDDVVTLPEIPHTATGKIQKTALRRRFADYRLPTA